MSLCGIGHLEGQLELLEAHPDNPGQALYDKLPRDKEGNLRAPDNPSPFLAAILEGTDPEEALEIAFKRDLDLLMAACRTSWQYGNEAEDRCVAYQDAVSELTCTITGQDIPDAIQSRSPHDNPALEPGGGLARNIANIRHLVRNLWMARQWAGEARQRLENYDRAIGAFSYAVPGAVQRGRILINRDKERERIRGSKGPAPA